MDTNNWRKTFQSIKDKRPVRTEEELVLKLDKSEVLDSHVLLPHAELNRLVYETVDRFVERYGGKALNITIVSEPFSEAVQDVIRESYKAHYQDEYQKVNRYLKSRFVRVISMIVGSLIAFTCGTYIANHFASGQFLAGAATQLSIFCFWEIGYTQFESNDAVIQKKHIFRAMNATIRFM